MGSPGPQNKTPAAIVVHNAMVNQLVFEISGFASFPPILTFPNSENIAQKETITIVRTSRLAIHPAFLTIQPFIVLIIPKNVS